MEAWRVQRGRTSMPAELTEKRRHDNFPAKVSHVRLITNVWYVIISSCEDGGHRRRQSVGLADPGVPGELPVSQRIKNTSL